MNLSTHNVNDYRANWKTLVHHIILNYKNSRPLYVGLTLFPDLYDDFSKKLFVSGLALKYSDQPIDLKAKNTRLFEEVFLIDYLKTKFIHDSNQGSVDAQNLNYLKCFKIVYDHYQSGKSLEKAEKIRRLAFFIGNKSDDKEFVNKLKLDFK